MGGRHLLSVSAESCSRAGQSEGQCSVFGDRTLSDDPFSELVGLPADKSAV